MFCFHCFTSAVDITPEMSRIIVVYVVISGNIIVRPNILLFYKVGAVIFSRVDRS